jgi:hypothetical protein
VTLHDHNTCVSLLGMLATSAHSTPERDQCCPEVANKSPRCGVVCTPECPTKCVKPEESTLSL